MQDKYYHIIWQNLISEVYYDSSSNYQTRIELRPLTSARPSDSDSIRLGRVAHAKSVSFWKEHNGFLSACKKTI